MDILPDPTSGRLWLVIARRAARQPMLDLAARLGGRGRLRVLDGGNSFNAYLVARALGRSLGAGGEKLENALKRIHVARAFTCYQMLTLLSETPAAPCPTLVLDLLATFYDESVALLESRRLLEECVEHLLRLSRLAPVVVSAQAPRLRPPSPDRGILVEILEAAAHQVLVEEARQPANTQLSLL